MGIDGGNDHEDGADYRQRGDHETLESGELLLLAHELDEHGDVHGVERNDGKLGAVEADGAKPGGLSKVGAEEV